MIVLWKWRHGKDSQIQIPLHECVGIGLKFCRVLHPANYGLKHPHERSQISGRSIIRMLIEQSIDLAQEVEPLQVVIHKEGLSGVVLKWTQLLSEIFP